MMMIYYLYQGDDVIGNTHLSVCVQNNPPKVMDGFWSNFKEMSTIAERIHDYIRLNH